MYRVYLVVMLCLVLVSAAVAGPMTWKTPVPTAADGGGANQQREITRKAIQENRDRIKAMGIFAGYTTQGN